MIFENMAKFILFLLMVFTLGFITVKVLNSVYEKQSVPYIDEIFHAHQAQLYCINNWTEWHPKITTFPGLYIISYILLKPLSFLGYENYCSLYALRMTNVIATLINFIISLQIIKSLEKNHNITSNTTLKLFSALNIAIFPPLYFFTFLFYTDAWSTTFVLLMYCLNLSKIRFSKLSVGLAGCMAVLMRQTNIVWVGLLLVDNTWKILSHYSPKNGSAQNIESTQKIIQEIFSIIFSFHRQKELKSLIKKIFLATYHLIFICGVFSVFVLLNGSIVLGDKAAHSPVLHFMQNMYFLNFSIFFGLPYVLTEVLSLWKKPPNISFTIFLFALCSALSELNKIEHPYLLADNRHLAFYVWKRIFGHPIIRRLLVPTYVASGFIFYRMIRNRCHFMFMVALSACIVLNLTPQHLFEFRYFIIPFIMWRLQFKIGPVVLLETVFFTVINIFVVFLFFNKTFVWPSEPEAVQRLIW